MFDNYYNDNRVIAGQRRDWFLTLDPHAMVATVRVYDPSPEVLALRIDDATDDDGECIVSVRCVNEVCPTCDGRGSHVNPSVDCNGLSRDDFDSDPDFAYDYMRGTYDVQCYGCKGLRVVPQIAQHNPKCILDAIDANDEEMRQYDAIRASERRYGC
jgi:hypothetical protein